MRVFVIDDADKMNDQAANALLKILEEPSPSNILILVTARPILNAIHDHFALSAYAF